MATKKIKTPTSRLKIFTARLKSVFRGKKDYTYNTEADLYPESNGSERETLIVKTDPSKINPKLVCDESRKGNACKVVSAVLENWKKIKNLSETKRKDKLLAWQRSYIRNHNAEITVINNEKRFDRIWDKRAMELSTVKTSGGRSTKKKTSKRRKNSNKK